MVYIRQGQMLDNRSYWRLSIIPELFWGLINFVVLFFQTMINPSGTKRGDGYSSDYRAGNRGNGPYGPGGGGGGRPQRRMGGFGGAGGGGPAPPPMAGGG